MTTASVREMKRAYPKKEVYIALDNLDFYWHQNEIVNFRKMYRDGKSVFTIAEYYDRPQEEIAILMMDQAMKGYIRPRPSGGYGKGVVR